ncbi:MAG: hypothetical protein N4A61_08210 [Pelagimonas sp.]|jgi:hypothetical protein|nr:hypothetical protein [Pelagimonas sp.]
MTRYIAFLALAVLVACQPDGDPDTEAKQLEQSCAAAGGKIIHAFGGLSCSMPTKDAGKACTDTFDCEGMCLGDAQTGGQCSQYTDMLGCHSILEKGEAMEICID